MTAIDVILFLIAVPTTLFVLLYGLTRRWWESWEGRALLTAAVGLMLMSVGFLVDDRWDVPDPTWLVVGSVIAVGAWLKLGLLLATMDPPRRLAHAVGRRFHRS